MNRRTATRLDCSPNSPQRWWVRLVALASCAWLSVAAANAQNASTTGRWTPLQDWPYVPIHIAIIPSPSPPFHSKLIWLQTTATPGDILGGVWNWSPATSAGENACTSYMTSAFTAQAVPSPGVDLFCSGHVQLADASGRILFTGGTEGAQEIGIVNNRIYDPASNTWSNPGDMAYRRWYPTATRLADGRPFVASGNSYNHLHMFGGKKSIAGSPTKELHRYGTSLAGQWDSSVPASGNWPAERAWHASPATQNLSDTRVFGGVGLDGQARNDLWCLTRDHNTLGSEYTYQWENRTINLTPAPTVRSRSAIVVFDPGGPEGSAESETTYVVGGIGPSGVVNSDVWKLYRASPTTWAWQQLVIPPGPNDPGPRWGHTAVFWRNAEHRRILLFGGAATAAGTPVDNHVYSLELKGSGALAWTKLEPRNDAQNGRPDVRRGHSMSIDPSPRLRAEVYEDRIVMFGGTGTPGGFTNDAWHLWVDGNGDIEWKPVNVTNLPPTRRAWHSASLDGAMVRLMVFGGEGDNGIADHTMWSLEPANLTADYDTVAWEWHPRGTQAFSLTGASAARFHRVVFSRIPETLNASGTPAWTALASAPLHQEWYPFNFVLPGSGKIFAAGPSLQSYQLDVATGGPWTPFPTSSSGFVGGAAVMYEPGKIMKCGTRDTEGFGLTATTTTKVVHPTSANPVEQLWRSSADMAHGRVNHNVVLLPTGKALVVGGTGTLNNQGNLNPVFRPEIWDPAANGGLGAWSGGSTLALAAGIRGYHSVAILLPDARVLSSGGEDDSNPNKHQAEIFCPPYLFKPDGSLAPQPRIINSPAVAGYGQTVRICATPFGTTDPVTASLIAPGSTTHGFDQNQRHVPVSISHVCGTAYDMVTPPDATHAPPGYYMLFVMNNLGVPSIAAWLRLEAGVSTPAPVCTGDCGGGCPMVDTRTSDGWQHENSVLARSSSGEMTYDAYRLKAVPEVKDGRVTLRLRENEQEVTTLDEVRLQVVDHDPETVVIGAGEGAVTGTRTPAFRVTTSSGEDITALLSGEPGHTGWQGSPGDTVLIEFEPPRSGQFGATGTQEGGGASGSGGEKEVELRWDPDAPGGRFAMEGVVTPTAATDAQWLDLTGIRVQVPDGRGGWEDLPRWYPREQPDDAYFPGLTHPQARLIFVGRHRLTFFGRMRPSLANVTSTVLTPVSATHSRLGDARSDVGAGGNATQLAPGDTVTMEFAVPPLEEGKVRDYVLVTNGVYSSDVGQARMAPRGSGLPQRFALMQNVPNPFASTTAIEFQLPRASRVKLEVFDLLGRRMRTLTDQAWPAGRHTVGWDRLTDAGARLSSGVYLYRMTADGFRDQKKMVIGAR